MADFTMSITHTFAPNTIIASAQVNTNFLNDVRDKYNAMINGTTGHKHTGATGDGPKIGSTGIDLADDYIWTGNHTFNGSLILNADSIITSFLSRVPGQMINVGFFISGSSLIIKQADGSDFADSTGNRGYLWLRSATNGKTIRGVIIANVTIDLDGAHWGFDTLGDLSNIYLRVYAINDGNTADDFTPKWGVGLQGGFTYIKNTQDNTTATNINLPEEILVNSNIGNNDSPMSDVGYIDADFTDVGDAWSINATYPGESADGLWMDILTSHTGFSSDPSYVMRFCMIKRNVHVQYRCTSDGTSNSTQYDITSPLKAKKYDYGFLANVKDNGVYTQAAGVVSSVVSSKELRLSPDAYTSTGFTIGNSKRANFTFFYEAYQP